MRFIGPWVLAAAAAAVATTAATQIARAQGARRVTATYKETPWYRGVAAEFRILGDTRLDVDRDGREEVLVFYRRRASDDELPGGMMVFARDAAAATERWLIAWHGWFQRCHPADARLEGDDLVLTIVETSLDGERRREVRWRTADDLPLRGGGKSLWDRTFPNASSTLHRDSVQGRAEDATDRDFATGWAEGRPGSGEGEHLDLNFSSPVALGLVGLYPGLGRGPDEWRDSNRPGKVEIVLQKSTEAARVAGGDDLSALGIGPGDPRIAAVFGTEPEMRYFQIEQRDVLRLSLRIAGVQLGDVHDDTWVSEVDLVEWVPRAKLRAPKKQAPPPE